VDGLLLLATVGLLRPGPQTSRRTVVFTWWGSLGEPPYRHGRTSPPHPC
jgi:hypothetical protein